MAFLLGDIERGFDPGVLAHGRALRAFGRLGEPREAEPGHMRLRMLDESDGRVYDVGVRVRGDLVEGATCTCRGRKAPYCKHVAAAVDLLAQRQAAARLSGELDGFSTPALREAYSRVQRWCREQTARREEGVGDASAGAPLGAGIGEIGEGSSPETVRGKKGSVQAEESRVSACCRAFARRDFPTALRLACVGQAGKTAGRGVGIVGSRGIGETAGIADSGAIGEAVESGRAYGTAAACGPFDPAGFAESGEAPSEIPALPVGVFPNGWASMAEAACIAARDADGLSRVYETLAALDAAGFAVERAWALRLACGSAWSAPGGARDRLLAALERGLDGAGAAKGRGSAGPVVSAAYEYLLLGEGLSLKAIAYCWHRPARVFGLLGVIADAYPGDAQNLAMAAFDDAISAEGADRAAYGRIRDDMRLYAHAFGAQEAKRAATELARRYPRRSALHAELQEFAASRPTRPSALSL